MAIDVSGTKAAIKAQLKTDFAALSGLTEATYDDVSEILSTAIAAALQHIKDDADVTGVSSGGDTVAGGVD